MSSEVVVHKLKEKKEWSIVESHPQLGRVSGHPEVSVCDKLGILAPFSLLFLFHSWQRYLPSASHQVVKVSDCVGNKVEHLAAKKPDSFLTSSWGPKQS